MEGHHIGPLGSPQDAANALCAGVTPVAAEHVPLERAPGRVLAAPLHADRASPAVSVSSMDGYAVRLADLRFALAATNSGEHASPCRVPICGEVHIGREPAPLQPGAAMRIVTGGALPLGADTVIKREESIELEPQRASVEFRQHAVHAAAHGQFVRRAGENLSANALVLDAGSLVTPAVAAALACFGHAQVPVHRRVRVAVLITGDEVLPASAAPTPWQLRDSNAATLRTMLAAPAWIELTESAHVPDEPEQLSRAIERLLQGCDALILTGGVSMGVRDFVPGAITRAGGRVLFHKVRQRPGNPILGARSASNQPIFALPGNAVSVMTTARRLVIPSLAHLAGLSPPRPTPSVELADPDQATIELWWHRPVRLNTGGRAQLVDSRGSGDLVAAARSDGFIELPPGAQGPGPWAFYPWNSL